MVFSVFHMDQFAKIRGHHLKERLKISKTAKFKSYASSANEDIATGEAKCRKCTNVCIGRGGGGGWNVCAPHAVSKVEERH